MEHLRSVSLLAIRHLDGGWERHKKRNILWFPLKDDIDFFGEKEKRKEHRGGGIIFFAVHVESRRSFGERGRDTDEDEAFSNFSLYPFIPTSSAGTRQ